jgi:hypothetical protein
MTKSASSYVTFTEDFTVSIGDYFELYLHTDYTTVYAYSDSFEMGCSISLSCVTES